MNFNDFVVLPNNKAKSVKLNARNLQELQMETVIVAQESKEMEEKLQQLKETMSKEKEERGHPGGFRWKFGQCASLNSNAITISTKKSKENSLQKLLAGRVKIRVLKDEPVAASSLPLPPPPVSTTGLRTVRKSRLRGTICGQCEVKTAGLMCVECTENYCIGCFAKFHQKGALKLHRMVPIQTDLQTHVSTPDVINCFQKQIEHSLFPGTFTNLVPSPNFKPHSNPHHTCTSSTSPRKGDQSHEGPKDVAKAMSFHPDPSQVLVMNHVREKKVEVKEEGLKRKTEEEFPMSLLRGEYSEEESARSFQEALKQWRREKSIPTGEPTCEGGLWKPMQPGELHRHVSVSAIATQVDLPPDREAEGRTSGGRAGRIPVIVKFTENSLTYMDRLLLKEHCRTPIEPYHTMLGFSKDLKSMSNTYTEEETANSLTAQEEDFRQYCASLFAVPVSRSRTEPHITSPESCLVIEVLDETDRDINGIFAAVQGSENNQKVPFVQWVSSKGRTLVPQATLTNAMPSKSKPSACPTVETPRTSNTSIKIPTSNSQQPNFSSSVQKTKADLGFPQPLSTRSLPDCQTKIINFSRSLTLSSPDISSFHKDLDSSPLPEQTLEQPQSSELVPEPISSAKLSQSPLINLEMPTQSQHSLCVPSSPSSDNQLQHPLSLLSSKSNPQLKSLESNTPSDLSLFHESTPPYEHTSVFMSFTPITGDHESTLSNQNIQCFTSLPSQLLNVIQNPPSAVKLEDVLSIDSADEISSDSLDLAPHEEDSSDEEAQMHRRIMRGRSRGEEQGNPAISHLRDSFVSADAEQEEDLQTDESEQLPETSMGLHNQSAGSGSELFCDLHGFMPLGLDVNSVRSDTPEHTQCDPLHTCQTSSPDSDPKGSNWSGKFTPTLSHPSRTTSSPSSLSYSLSPAFFLPHPTLGSEMGLALRPLSQAAQEIMEICSVDQKGCEDPDLDNDTSEHTLHSLEQELRLIAKETGAHASVFGMGNSGSQDQRGTQHLTWSRVDKKQKEEEETTQKDRESVLLLP